MQVLYILMRTDMDSMNPGKAMAQASHASNAFLDLYEQEMQNIILSTSPQAEKINQHVTAWKNQSRQGFGTVLVLGGKYEEIKQAVRISKQLGYLADMVLDETYPLRDGETTHFFPVETCGFVFVEEKETDTTARTLLSRFDLHA